MSTIKPKGGQHKDCPMVKKSFFSAVLLIFSPFIFSFMAVQAKKSCIYLTSSKSLTIEIEPLIESFIRNQRSNFYADFTGSIYDFYGANETCYDPGRRKNSFMQEFSAYEFGEYNEQKGAREIKIRSDCENLIKTFCRKVVGKHAEKMIVDWGTTESSIQTLERLKHVILCDDCGKRLRKKALRRLDFIFGPNYLFPFIEKYQRGLLKKYIAEQFEKKRAVEREENKKIASERFEHKNIVEINNTQEMVFLDDKKLKILEDIRFSLYEQKDIEASKTYLKMLEEIEIEFYQNDGSVSKRVYKRIIACDTARDNHFRKVQKNYILNDHAQKLVPLHLCSLEELETCNGDEIQQNVHEEIVDFVNLSSSYLDSSYDNESNSSPDLYEAASVAMHLKNKIKKTNDSVVTKIYERTYSFLDFCHNLLRVKIGRAILCAVDQVEIGFLEGVGNVKEIFQESVSRFFSKEISELFCDDEQNLEKHLEKERFLFEEKRKALGDAASNFFQTIKEQPLSETAGEALKFLLRKVGQTTAIAGTVILATAALKAGSTAITGVAGTIAASNALRPIVTKMASDGTAIIDRAASIGVLVWDSVAMACGQVAQGVCGLLEPAGHLYCAMDVGGGGQHNISNKNLNETINESEYKKINFEKKQLQKKFKHAIDFGLEGSWNKNAADKYRKALTDFINKDDTEVMHALFRKEPAIFYINKKTGLFVVEIEGFYHSGWKLEIGQLKNFLRSGNLN